MEIERKFKITTDISSFLLICEPIHIKQGYLSINPEVRVRKANGDYSLTIKSDGDLTRQETIIPINVRAYNGLISQCDNVLAKTRYKYKLENNHIAEIDVYNGILNGLVTAEVEFQTIDEAQEFVPPFWFGEELTNNSNYKNKNIMAYFKNRPANNK